MIEQNGDRPSLPRGRSPFNRLIGALSMLRGCYDMHKARGYHHAWERERALELIAIYLRYARALGSKEPVYMAIDLADIYAVNSRAMRWRAQAHGIDAHVKKMGTPNPRLEFVLPRSKS